MNVVWSRVIVDKMKKKRKVDSRKKAEGVKTTYKTLQKRTLSY